MYAGHLQSRCSAVSISPQLGQLGLLVSPMVCKCLLRGQWPVSVPVSLFMFFLLSDNRYQVLFAFILMQFLACLA